MPVYFEVGAHHVDAAARHVAHESLRIACLDLGIPDTGRPAVKWFSEANEDDRAYVRRYGEHVAERLTTDGNGILEGRSIRDENVIWIRVSSDLKSLAETVGHEIAHIYIGRQRGGAWTPRELAHQEALANDYGRHFLKEDHR